MTSTPGFCRGNQWVPYRRLAPPTDAIEYVETDLHAALVENGDGPADCANRYHIRMWGDARHEVLTNTSHNADEAWIVGAAHYAVSITLRRAGAWMREQGCGPVRAVMSDNAKCYATSHAFAETLAELDARHILSPPFTPR